MESEILTVNKENLKSILSSHVLWLNNDPVGKQADLRGADLSGANLRGANLRWANLRGADLSRADLRGADLRGADLRWANLSGADLSEADLSRANLSEADLSGADLSEADLSRADLRGADLSGANLSWANLRGANLTMPEDFLIVNEGDLIVYKKLREGVCKLLIPKDAQRINSTSRKCRSEYAIVLELPEGVEEGTSKHDPYFKYRLNEKIVPDSYNHDFREECSNGIHFFLTYKEAEEY